MEPSNLPGTRLPRTSGHLHLLGIGGAAMAPVAGMLQERGYHVTGSDVNVYPPASTLLSSLGIRWNEGFREDNLKPAPDLAVLDLNLPKNGGLQVLRAIRESQEWAKVPVVIVSSSASPQDLAKTQRLGVERYITKPPDLDGFLQAGQIFRDILMASRSGLEISHPGASID